MRWWWDLTGMNHLKETIQILCSVVGEHTECQCVRIYGITARGILLQREKYDGERSEDDMQNFVLSRLKVTVMKVDEEVWKHDRGSSSWLLILCQADDGGCLDAETRLKLAATLVI